MVAHRFTSSNPTPTADADRSRKIRCHVITVPADAGFGDARVGDDPARSARSSESAPRFRPSDLVPWADPYIAGLIHRLQDEVRREGRPAPAVKKGLGAPVADLEWPWEDRADDYQPMTGQPMTGQPMPSESTRESERWSSENRLDR